MSAQQEDRPVPGDENIAAFYEQMTLLDGQPFEFSEAKLKSFLSANPDCERVYIYLLEHWLYSGDEHTAQSYFDSLAALPQHRRNSLWMLARISVINDDLKKALSLFQQSLKSGVPGYLLIDDFVRFVLRYPEKTAPEEKLSMVLLGGAEQLLLARTMLAFWQDNFSEALRLISQFPDKYRQHPFTENIAGFIYLNTEKIVQAEEAFRRGAALAETHNDLALQAFNLASLAWTLTLLKQPDAANSAFRQCGILKDKTDDLFVRQYFCQLQAYAQDKLYGNTKEARKSYQKSIKISEAIGRFDYTARQLLQLAQLEIKENNFNDVLAYIDRSYNLAKQSNDLQTSYFAQIEKGNFLNKMKLGYYARFPYQEALKIAQQRRNKKQEAVALIRLADVELQRLKYSRAADLYSRYLGLDEALPNNILFSRYKLAMIFFHKKQWDSSLREIESLQADLKSSGLKDDYWTAFKTRLDIVRARIYLEIEDTGSAEKLIEKMDLVDHGALEIRKDLAYIKGLLQKKLENYATALTHFKAAAHIVESQRKTVNAGQIRSGYFSGVRDIYAGLVSTLSLQIKADPQAEHLVDSLYFYLEMSRARVLRDLRSARGQPPAAKPADSLADDDDYLIYRRQLKKIQWEMRFRPFDLDADILTAYEVVRSQFLNSHLKQQMHHGSQDLQPLSLADYQQEVMPDNTTLIIYSLSAATPHAMVVNRDSSLWISLNTTQKTIKDRVDHLMKPFWQITENVLHETPFRADAAYELYKLLLAPLELRIALNQNLLIVPDFPINHLPFEMLLTEKSKSKVYYPTDEIDCQKAFLLNRYTIQITPSTWLSDRRSPAIVDDPAILAIGEINHYDNLDTVSIQSRLNLTTRWPLSYLPFAAKEALAIQEIHSNTDILKKSQATPENLHNLAKNYNILHLASHAFIDSLFPAYSGLVLSNSLEDTHQDGFLMGFDIANLPLDSCQLVTLSACATSWGKFRWGEGILSLPRLFLSAGARRVMMTNWQVDDKFTLAFMQQFYSKYLNKGMTQAEALQKTKSFALGGNFTTNKSRYSHPVYWAPFVLYGELESPVRKRPKAARWYFLLLFIVIVAAGLILWWFLRKRDIPERALLSRN